MYNHSRNKTLGKTLAKTLVAAGALALASSSSATAGGSKVTWEDLLNDHKTNGDVLSYGLGLKAQRWSTLDQINSDNVGRLTPKWSFSFGDEKQRGQESQALGHKGVIYVTASYSRHLRFGRENW